MTWVLDQEDRRHRYLLLSLGNDGKILVWELVSGQKELKAVKALRLLTESVPRSIRISRAKGGAEIGGEWESLYVLANHSTFPMSVSQVRVS